MTEGRFYFLSDEYYARFQNCGLMGNKEADKEGKPHGRPCLYMFLDVRTGLYWMIPISSKIEKYERIFRKNINKYGQCDFIVFGEVLGRKSVFLIQNMCPVTEKYIDARYLDRFNKHVGIPIEAQKHINAKAKKVLQLARKGKKLVFSDVLKIEKTLMFEK